MSIDIQSLFKQFGIFPALDDVNLTIKKGEFVALLGPSGSGKTTLLRTIAGLEIPNSGKILFNKRDVTNLSTREREMGFIFQHYALFKHMTVFENVAFGLRVLPKNKRPSDKKINEKVMELLTLVQLDWLQDRFPAQLSGGQKQRIALARALAVEPQVLLLDEPFGALDTTIRRELRNWLRSLHDRLQMTSIFVTHDVDEALEIADKVVVMNEGKIIQVDTPENIYHHPKTAFVYKFIANVTLFHARKQENSLVETLVRPDAMSISLKNEDKSSFKATIESLKHLGHSIKLVLHADEDQQEFELKLSPEDPLIKKIHAGSHVYISIDKEKAFLDDYQI